MREKRVAIKFEGGKGFDYYYSKQAVEDVLYELSKLLKVGMAIQVNCGRESHFIDYDEDAEGDYSYEIKHVMYYVKQYLTW